MPLPLIGFNPDDGLFIGGRAQYINYRYKKAPYGESHAFQGQYAFETSAYDLSYEGEYIEAFGNWDGVLKAEFQAPTYVINYFGFGNESV